MTVLQFLFVGMGMTCVAFPGAVQRAFARLNKDLPIAHWWQGRGDRIGFMIVGVGMLLIAAFNPFGVSQ